MLIKTEYNSKQANLETKKVTPNCL